MKIIPKYTNVFVVTWNYYQLNYSILYCQKILCGFRNYSGYQEISAVFRLLSLRRNFEYIFPFHIFELRMTVRKYVLILILIFVLFSYL